MSTSPTLAQLQRGLAISEQIAALEAELASLFSGSTKASAQAASPAPAKAPVKSKKGGMSAEGRARIVAAQKARWAKIKGETAAPAPKAPAKAKAPVKKKGGISPEGRARIIAAQKARWAKVKAAKAPVAATGKKK